MELKQYILPLRKWWWLILASTLVASMSSILATRQQAPIYQTRTTLMIGRAISDPNPIANDVWLTQQLASTYSDIAQRAPVREAAMEELGLAWLPGYNLRVVPNTQLIELTVTDTNPARAQAVANTLAEQLILQSPSGLNPDDERRQIFINQQLLRLEQGIEETQIEIEQKQEELASMFSARQIADTRTQIQSLQSKLVTLQANYAALLANTERGAVNSLSVIEPAALPTMPTGPNKMYTILLAAIIGFGLAAAAAYVLEYLDDTLKNPDDVQKELKLTTLGAVPDMSDEIAQEEYLAAFHDGHSSAKEAYRVLRTNLQFATIDKPLRQLMVTSPMPNEGKSLTTANLGVALAQAGKRVILVDSDLHRPRIHRLFKLPNNIGLTTALLDENPQVTLLLRDTQQAGLRVLTSGPLPPNPAELLGSERMRHLIESLQAQADVLILDSPPATVLSDAVILSTEIDDVLLVLKSGQTRREAAKRAVEALNQVNAHILGVLLNQLPTRGNGYQYYYYYYYYDRASYYSDDDDQQGGSSGGLFPWGSRKRKKKERQVAEKQPAVKPLSAVSDRNKP